MTQDSTVQIGFVDPWVLIGPLYMNFLKTVGFGVRRFEDNKDLLAVCDGKQAMPDLFMVQWRLSAVDGFEFTRELRHRGCPHPVIIMSMSPVDVDQRLIRALRFPFPVVQEMPADTKLLVRRVVDALERSLLTPPKGWKMSLSRKWLRRCGLRGHASGRLKNNSTRI